MTAREWGIALLCCAMPGDCVAPLTLPQLRTLRQRVLVMGMPNAPMAELRPKDLRDMGYAQEQAEQIYHLLAREAQLEQYLNAAMAKGIHLVTRLSPDYPDRLRLLGQDAPAVLFVSGDVALFSRAAISLVGCRDLHEPGRSFARQVGTLAAQEDYALASGNAAGADQAAQAACLAAGGSIIAFVADELTRHLSQNPARQLMVSEGGYDLPFSNIRALRRNHFIHVQGEKCFVAQCNPGFGGTWSGTAENLRRGWTEVYVCEDGSHATELLCKRGAIPIAPERLTSLSTLHPAQVSLFD